MGIISAIILRVKTDTKQKSTMQYCGKTTTLLLFKALCVLVLLCVCLYLEGDGTDYSH